MTPSFLGRVRGRPVSTRVLVAAAVGVYLLFRVVGAGVMVWIAGHQDPTGIPGGQPGDHVGYWGLAHIWDGRWYENIARSGYPAQVPLDATGRAAESELAFYPLYPLLVRGVMAVSGGSFAVVGSLTSLLLGAVAAGLMVVLLRRHIGALGAWCAVLVVVSSPPAVTFQMTYTESLAMVLLLAVLLALDREQWAIAGVLGLLIGFTRPIGVPLAALVAILVFRRWRERRRRAISRREAAEVLVGIVGCGVSGALWPLTAWALTGRSDAYGSTMAAWRNHTAMAPFAGAFDLSAAYLLQPWATLLVLGAIVALLVVVVGPWSARLGLVLRAWCVLYVVYLAATVVPWSSTFRYLLELFPLAAVLVGAGWRRRSELVAPLTALVVIVNVLATLWWAWNFLRFVPPYGNPV